ncbi:MAG: polyhydroxyalkanoate synthesis regulator DNA-binding domain-containing protein [Deltaproteobacteria bacterium]
MATVLIKKYGNRRLYDTGDSRYITLDELAAKVRTGVDVRVVDAQNGEDLTQATLVQVVLEAGNAAKFLPVQLLTQMIRLSDDSLAEFFSRYVTSALDLYLQAKRGVQSITQYNPLAQIPMAATDAIARMWMGSPFAQPYQQQYGGGSYPAPPSPYPPGPMPVDVPTANGDAHEPHPESNGGKSDDVAAMRRELEELKQAVRESIASRPAKRSATTTKKKT